MNIPGTLQPVAHDLPAASLQLNLTATLREPMLEDHGLVGRILLGADGAVLAPSSLVLERYLNQPAV